MSKLLLSLAIVSLLLAACLRSTATADPPAPTADSAIAGGLAFLASQQNAQDGYFGPTQKPAVTSLALLSFLACGHAPNSANVGKYGPNVGKAIDYLLNQAQADGSFGRSEKPMYAQAMATLALAEALGVDDSEARRKRIAAALVASVKFILAAQDVHKLEMYAGGWRYEANSVDSDLVVTGWNLMALRACLDSGINVPRGAFGRVLKFVLKCYNPAEKGFANQPGGTVDTNATAIGALCLRLLNSGLRLEAQNAIATLADKPPDNEANDSYFGTYCQTLAGFQVGDPLRRRVLSVSLDKLIRVQQGDGSWPDDDPDDLRAGRSYKTSLALLSLSVPLRLLPAHQ